LLSDEGKRWLVEINQIEEMLLLTVGNVFLSTCQMNYLGPFSGEFRQKLLGKWMDLCQQKEI
jgi:hypothetical protein